MQEEIAKSQVLVDIGRFSALAILVCLAVTALPQLAFLTLAFSPLPVLIVAVRHSVGAGLAVAAISAVVLLPLIGVIGATTLLLVIVFLGLGYAFAVKKSVNFAAAMIAGTALVALSVIAFGLLTLQVEKVNIVGQQMAEVKKEVAALKTEYIKQGISKDQIKEQFQTINEGIKILPKILPALIILFSAWTTFLSVLFSGYVLKRLKESALSITAFENWQMPWYFAWGYILGLAGTFFYGYLGSYRGIGQTVGMNFLVVFNLLFLVQGFSIIYFYLEKFKVRGSLKVLAIGLLIAIPLAAPVIGWLGLLDVWFNFRKIPAEA